MCGSMADIQSATAEIRRGIKKKKEERNHSKNIMVCPIPYRATIIKIISTWSSQPLLHRTSPRHASLPVVASLPRYWSTRDLLSTNHRRPVSVAVQPTASIRPRQTKTMWKHRSKCETQRSCRVRNIAFRAVCQELRVFVRSRRVT